MEKIVMTVVILIFVKLISSFEAGIFEKHFSVNFQYNNLQFRTVDVIHVATRRRMNCPMICSKMEDCSAFNRKTDKENLYLCQILLVPVTDIIQSATSNHGWKFYEVR